ncbi:hypothetical protein [Terrisporobacter vanillatitrophus]|uniref:hypothetical protein n=1 Tax=Terrisporobacter vanillatitrophus TaxID=3058402 RepID=UPI003365F024
MKKLILALIVVLSLSTGCAKNNEKIEDTPKEETKNYGNEANGVKEKPEIKEEKDNDSEKTETSNTSNDSDTSNKNEESEYERGYKDGYKDGYYKAKINDTGDEQVINSEYDRGYSKGFDNGWTQCVTDGKDYESKKKKEENENIPKSDNN